MNLFFATHSTAFIFFFTKLISGFLQIGVLLLLTRTLEPSEYGAYSIFLIVYTLCITLLANPWRHALIRFLPADKSSWPALVWKIGLGLGASLHIGMAVLGTTIVLSSMAVEIKIFIALIVATLCGGFVEFLLEIYRRRLDAYRFSLISVARSLIQANLVALAAILWSQASWITAAFACAQAIVFIFMANNFLTANDRIHLKKLRKQTDTLLAHLNKQAIKKALANHYVWLSYGTPLALAEFLNLSIIFLDRLMTERILGLTHAGLYAGAADLVWYPLHLLALAASLTILPQALNAAQNDLDNSEQSKIESSKNASLSTSLLIMTIGPSVGVAILAEPISQFVLGPSFREGAADLMRWLAFAHLVFAVKIFWLDVGLMLCRKTSTVFATSALGVVLNLILTPLFAFSFGTIGVAVATSTAITCASVVAAIAARDTLTDLRSIPFVVIGKLTSAAIAMAIILLLLPSEESLIHLLFSIFVGAILYLGICLTPFVSIFSRRKTENL